MKKLQALYFQLCLHTVYDQALEWRGEAAIKVRPSSQHGGGLAWEKVSYY